MRPINQSLHKLTKQPTFKERYDRIRKEVLAHSKVRAFLEEHPQLDDEAIDRSVMKLYEYTQASHNCDRCANVEQCVNVVKGLEPELILSNDTIDLHYKKCPSRQKEEQQKETERMISSMYMPKDVLRANLSNTFVDGDTSRIALLEAADSFLSHYDKTGKLPAKGIYIHGPFGVGKSYILGAIANELADRHIQTVIVYVPEFLREMKQSIQDHTLNEKLEYVKRAQVLMLDDIGAESMSAWTRDEVLGTILQYRMAEQLPTFFTSNFGWSELKHHLTYSQRGEQEEMKAARIMQRIETISILYELRGSNLRKQSSHDLK